MRLLLPFLLVTFATQPAFAQLGVILYPQTNPIPEDERAVWTLLVWNEGANTLDNVGVSIVLPDHIHSFSAPEGTSCDGSSFCSDGETLEWPIGQLAPSENISLRYGATLENNVPSGTILNSFATASADDVSDATYHDQLDANEPAIRLGIGLSPDRAVLNDTLSATLTIGNTDSTPREEVIVTLDVPDGVSLAQAGPLVRQEQSKIFWNVGQLLPNEGAQVNVDLVVGASLPAQIPLLFAAKVSDAFNPDGTAEAIEMAPFVDGPKLSATVENDSGGDSTEGEIVRYSVEITNTSTDAVADVEVEIRLPDNIDGFNAPSGTTCEGSSFCSDGELMSWDVGGMLAGITRVLAFSIETENNVPAGFIQECYAVASNPAQRLAGTEAAILVGNLVPPPDPTSVEPAVEASHFALTISPNPVARHSHLVVSTNVAQGERIEILDLLGRTVWSSVLEQRFGMEEMIISVDHLPVGFYIMRLESSRQSLSKPFTVVP